VCVYTLAHTHTHTYVHIYVHVCVCVCVYMYIYRKVQYIGRYKDETGAPY